MPHQIFPELYDQDGDCDNGIIGQKQYHQHHRTLLQLVIFTGRNIPAPISLLSGS
jgi:hypothetical protein